jgi:adenine-specific DNA-methyltransferase
LYFCYLKSTTFTADKPLQNQEITLTEQNLFYFYLKSNRLDYRNSPILSNYFVDFEPKDSILSAFAKVDICSLKDVERTLEVLIPTKDRKLNGAFFTPTYIVDFILHEIAPRENSRNIDLSCGCGAFLIGLLDYYKRTFVKPLKEVVRENIFGVDILPYNVRRAKMLLAVYVLEHGEIIEENDLNIWQADSLRANWNERFDNVIGNPPYVKFQDLSEDNRTFLSNDWRTIKNGTFNLYFAFFELGYKLLQKEGTLGYITPNNYFTSLAGEPLRQFFQHEKCVSKIVDFNHRKIFDVQTYTAITFLKKVKQNGISYDRIDDGQTPPAFLQNATGSLNRFGLLNAKKWRLLKTDEQENIRRIEKAGAPIGQVFDICVGIATLKDEVFFVDGSTDGGDYFWKLFDGKMYQIEKTVTHNVFKISDFKGQEDILQNTRKIIFPYRVKGGQATPIPEEDFSRMYPKCYAYLKEAKEILRGRDKGKTEYSPFYVWGRSQGLTRFGKKLLVPTFSKYPRFMRAEDKEAFFTNGYGIYFREASLFEHPLGSADKIDVIQKVLNSCVMHYYISKTSVSIQGGYPCYQKNFIEKFSLPQFTSEEIAFLRMTSDKGEIDAFLINKYQVKIPLPNLV